MALSTQGKRRGHKRRIMADINVTPMVDVMLVLLVIFMVAAPMLTPGVPVNLPDGAAALPQNQETPLALTVGADGTLYLQDAVVNGDELISTLASIMDQRQSDKIFVRADGENSYGDVFRIMGMLSAEGYSNIGLVGDVPAPQGQ